MQESEESTYRMNTETNWQGWDKKTVPVSFFVSSFRLPFRPVYAAMRILRLRYTRENNLKNLPIRDKHSLPCAFRHDTIQMAGMQEPV